MTGFSHSSSPVKSPFPWYAVGLLGIGLFSVALRFWGLERFNTLVFDEVYYAKFANNYLTGTPFFDGHPPLSKYMIAVSIWLAERLHLGPNVGNELTGAFHTTWSYRWSAALTGSFIPIVVAELARQISQNRCLALIAGGFVALDGLFLVESRYALNNVYLVLFGLLGQLCFVLAARSFAIRDRQSTPQTRLRLGWRWRYWGWLSLAGVSFAAATSIKWNGLWFLLGAYSCWAIGWLYCRVTKLQRQRSLFWQFGQMSPIAIALWLGLLPFLVYALIWVPHLQLNRDATFWGLQQQILAYHQGVKSGKAVHPYCSDWWSWLWMQQPVAYFYQVGIDPTRVLPPNGVVKPEGSTYAVHAMGNPILWWASTAAIGGLLLTTISSLWQRLQAGLNPHRQNRRPILATSDFGLACYILVNYLANLLPWTRVTRCIFLYHYMGASVFSMIALAWWCDRAWRQPALRIWVAVLGLLIVGAFWFWLPIYLGLPLSSAEYQLRMWFKVWICGANC
jgi:dolichyl-phosphate-mannose--protein O-mannosyl transferase